MSIEERQQGITHNGCVYETFGISKHCPIKLQVLLIRAETLDNTLTAKCFIYDVSISVVIVILFLFSFQIYIFRPINSPRRI